MSEDNLRKLTRDDFTGCLGETFVIRVPEAPEIDLRLAEANTTGGDSDDREPFSLIFLGPAEPILQQAIYPLEHESLGTISLFLVPVGPDPTRSHIQYEAVFS